MMNWVLNTNSQLTGGHARACLLMLLAGLLRKWPMLHPQRLGTVCVQPDKHWPCLETDLWETGVRRGGACVGLSKDKGVILS